MVYSVQQIKFEMLSYMKEYGGGFHDWYVGVASDPLLTMTQEHKVDKERDIWLYKQALSFTACRTLQRYFLETLKTDGIPVQRGADDTDCIYLYKKSEETSP